MSNSTHQENLAGINGLKRVIEHGQILNVPARPIENTTGHVTYELGFCGQIDESHCLLIASMDEQGGGDLCVGNDAFVFERLSDIAPEHAIPINRVDPDYQLKRSEGRGFLAKFPGRLGFVPLGAKLGDGSDHPAAGTGFVLSTAIAKNGKHAAAVPESIFELIQLRWDGQELKVAPGVLFNELLGHELNGTAAITPALPFGPSLLWPMGVGDGIRIFQFDWNGQEWAATQAGPSFNTNPGRAGLPGEEFHFAPGETEPSLRRQDDRFLAYTRGADGIGRLYQSRDGFNFELLVARANITVPQVLNQGLNGDMYLATNPGPGMLRNPLLGYQLDGDEWTEPFTLHDEQGIRSDEGPLIPLVDHSIANNVVLEGRRRHFNFFRVCELSERTLHTFQLNEGLDKIIYGENGPRTSKLPTSGLYLTELEYE